MAKFGRGGAGIESAAKQSSGGGKFTPTLKWEKDETKFIQFLHPLDDALTVFYHGYTIVGETNDGNPKFRHFVSPKTDSDGDGNLVMNKDEYDPIWDRFKEPGKKRTFAVAVELKPITESVKKNGRMKKTIVGFEVATREYTDKDGEEHEVPAVGLIEGSPSAFFSALQTFEDSPVGAPIESLVFQTTRKGESKDTRYDHARAGDALTEDELDIPEELLIDLEAYLEDMVMTDEDIALLDDLPEDHLINKFANRGKKKSGSKTKSSSTKTRSSSKSKPKAKLKEEPEEDENDDPEDDEGDDEDDAKANRFANLRRSMATTSRK